MSQAISPRSSRNPKRKRVSSRQKRSAARSSYLRLYGDFTDELNAAVVCREEQGWTRSKIAERAGLDPAVLSKVLAGKAGNNLRTIAAVLVGVDHRVKMQAIPCEELRYFTWTSASGAVAGDVTVLDFAETGHTWQLDEEAEEAKISYGVWNAAKTLELEIAD